MMMADFDIRPIEVEGVPVDFRTWLTITSEHTVLLSARDRTAKAILHGLALRRGFCDEVISSSVKHWPADLSPIAEEAGPTYAVALGSFENAKMRLGDRDEEAWEITEDDVDEMYDMLLSESGKE